METCGGATTAKVPQPRHGHSHVKPRAASARCRADPKPCNAASMLLHKRVARQPSFE